MVILRPEIQRGIVVVFQMEPVPPGGNEGGLGKKRGVVVAAAPVRLVGQPGDFRLLVAAHALFPRPDGEEPSPQVQVGELLAAAGDVLVPFRGKAQPQTVETAPLGLAVGADHAVFLFCKFKRKNRA